MAPLGVSPFTFYDTHYYEKDKYLKLELQLERELMTRAKNIIYAHSKPKKWFYGHYHQSVSEVIEDVNFRLMDIGELTNG